MQCRLTRKTSLSAFFPLSFLPRYFSPLWLCVCCCCLAPPVRSWSRPLVRALRIAGFGLFSVCAAGLAVAALLPGSVIPLCAAQRCELTLFYKRASSQPANTRWHSLISDRAIDEYLPRKGEICNGNLLILSLFSVFLFHSTHKTRKRSGGVEEPRSCWMKTD